MAQLTNEQWSRMTQEQRDAYLRGLVSYGKTVTGRFSAECPAKGNNPRSNEHDQETD